MTARSKSGKPGRRPHDARERRAADTPVSATDHYHREKARRNGETGRDSELVAAAKREYLALLAAEALKGKGGRPKKNAAKRPAKPADTDGEDEENEEHDE